MTISSTNRRNDYVGNGAVSTYAYTFLITDETHLRVTVRDTDGVETTLTLNTHYTVTGVDTAAGGNVVLTAGSFAWLTSNKLTTDYALAIRRVVPLKQETSIRNQGGAYYASLHEDVFDYLIFVDQQQQDSIDRSVKLPESVSPSDFRTELPADIADNAGSSIMVNEDGDGLTLSAAADAPVERVFPSGLTYSTFKAAAAAAPTTQRMGYCSDIQQYMFYCANTAIGDDGCFALGGG